MNSSPKTQERLQKFLSRAGICSRRQAEKLILDSRVCVNGHVVTELGTKIDAAVDEVFVDGKRIEADPAVIYAFHKPTDVITSMDDPQGRRCVGQYASELPLRVFPVGRLDRDVVGLLLFTNDGDYANELLHPRYETKRTYWAVLEGEISKKVLCELVSGVELKDGSGRADSAERIEWSKKVQDLFGQQPDATSLVEVVVSEGRKHFVKNLFHVVGHPVERLARIAFGPFELGNLREGEFCELSFKKLH